MPSPVQLDTSVLGIDRKGLHALRHALGAPPPDPAAFLQETGYQAGEWMRANCHVDIGSVDTRRIQPAITHSDDEETERRHEHPEHDAARREQPPKLARIIERRE